MSRPKRLWTPEEIEAKRLRQNAMSLEWNRAHPDRCKASAERRKQRAQEDPALRAKLTEMSDRARFKRMYGITYEQRDAALVAQKFKCLLCDKPAKVADHNHKTGKFRGMLCQWCNVFLGHIEHSSERLERALAYLAKHEQREPIDDAGDEMRVAA